jgi:hypothetical protein
LAGSFRGLFGQQVEQLAERARGRAIAVAPDPTPQHFDRNTELQRYAGDDRAIAGSRGNVGSGLWARQEHLGEITVVKSADRREAAKAGMLELERFALATIGQALAGVGHGAWLGSFQNGTGSS